MCHVLFSLSFLYLLYFPVYYFLFCVPCSVTPPPWYRKAVTVTGVDMLTLRSVVPSVSQELVCCFGIDYIS